MKILVAASGGVAALKTPTLLRRLFEQGHEVRAAATEDAYHFITKLSLAVAAGGEVVDRETWFTPHGRALHIELARWADLLVVAPASADALASAATGRADDIVSATILAGIPAVAWVPAMNTEMWHHAAVQHNIQTLQGYGHQILGPAHGTLAARGEGTGVGRMLEPEEVVTAIQNLFRPQDLTGQHVLVSAGPTREYLDPVRFISNPSSGKMGYAIAEAAKARGATVTLVSGPTSLPAPSGIDTVHVESAQEMLNALAQHLPSATVLVMTAAVADWRAAHPAAEKQAKMGEKQTVAFIRTPDILQAFAPQKGDKVFIGFAMETNQGVERAADKARRKNLDFICLNYPTRPDTGFGGDTNQVTIVTPDAQAEELPLTTKRALADLILDRALQAKENQKLEPTNL